MTLRIAVQMDPIDRINIAGDSSFALMLSAQDRGLCYSNGISCRKPDAGRGRSPFRPCLPG